MPEPVNIVNDIPNCTSMSTNVESANQLLQRLWVIYLERSNDSESSPSDGSQIDESYSIA